MTTRHILTHGTWVFVLALSPFFAHAIVVDILFPLDVPAQYRDDFGEPRVNHAHRGIDIIAPKMSPILSTVNGHVRRLEIPQASWGYEISIRGDDGYVYNYLHINNDTPGSDDGAGGIAYAYAPGIHEGTRVTRGQLIGWVGDSGNAEEVGSHLHFEMRTSDRTLVNPYESLRAAKGEATSSVPATTPEPTHIFTRSLAVGSRGIEVQELQKLLFRLGYFKDASVTGYYGPITKNAVTLFQKAEGIDPIGIVGPLTRKALNTQGNP